MNENVLNRIDQAIERSMVDLKQDLVKLIAIKSVKGDPLPGAPFGPGPRAVLDAVLDLGKQEGFYPVEHTEGVISLSLKKGQPDLGIWLHGDVVPEGAGWDYDPYQATEYKGCIIGRGATDNKGQLCAIFHLLKIFKDLGVELNYNPALYVGSNEETGMKDIPPFLETCEPPRLSLVPDASFPVGYGGKGGMTVTFRGKRPLHGIQIVAGQDDDPGKAVAKVYGKSIITHSPPHHSANPDPYGNMITRLMEKLLEEDLAVPEDRPVLEFFRMVSLDTHGEQLGIYAKPEEMSALTVYTQKMDEVKGCPALTVNIRYPVGITFDEIVARAGAVAQTCGLEISDAECRIEPYLLDKTWPVITRLAEIANEVTGEQKKLYTLGGGTYAHKLPNALAFGMDGNKKPEDFPQGHGGAHGVDECVSLDRLRRAMKIYARARLALNDMAW